MRKHAFDVTAFVWGVLFLFASVVVARVELQDYLIDIRWIVPLALVAAGIAGIASAVRNRHD